VPTDLPAEEIRRVWDGHIQPIPSELVPAGVPAATREFLTTVGLPTVPPWHRVPFFHDDRLAVIPAGGKPYLAVGGLEVLFVVDLDTGHVHDLDVCIGADQPTHLVNSSLALFLFTAGVYRQFQERLRTIERPPVATLLNFRQQLRDHDPAALADDDTFWSQTLDHAKAEWE
jgi:hypothetical protein